MNKFFFKCRVTSREKKIVFSKISSYFILNRHCSVFQSKIGKIIAEFFKFWVAPIQLVKLALIQLWVVANWFSWCQFNFEWHLIDPVNVNLILGGTWLVQFVSIQFQVALNWFSWSQFNIAWHPISLDGVNFILGDATLIQLMPNWILVAPNWFSWC